ncbi:DUF3987 domain-containing protein [Pseudoxanthomonas wuyuanensis]|uniref:DUF3987 domain-containing protein n=1 Tax=Pseudoxanthomonas wuyuanensis TaxID=1073196 RepID=A0A286D7X8_9GAMM|nr:DUF3987 domain-containing protein [Pseudoxanthomonas wuyuanensis]KAF1720162.1 DUF3987 domain-containing protein [Pseudoxanthomonas wuyuanensis]SOD54772.1 Protein of unknown function [Pseudoxanthomonas wuyuanensis]
MYPFPRHHAHCPIDALPDLLYDAAHHLHRQLSDIPPCVLLTDAIAAAAAAVHLSYDVAGPDGRLMPCTLNTLAVCRSGLGKGTSYHGFFKPFYEFENESDGEELLLQEVSYRALMEALHGTGRALSIQHEDGDSFLDSQLLKKCPDKLTQFWSGKPPIKHRVRGISLVATDARCSLGMRIQPKIFYPFLIRTDSKTFVQGLWPRAIAACYDPVKFYEPMAFFSPPSANQAGLKTFHDRVTELLARAKERAVSEQLVREPLRLEDAAAAFMVELKHRIKQWESEYEDIAEARDRAWENTLRLGAVFHVMCGDGNAISLEMVQRAWDIVEWSLGQHRKIFVEAIAPHVQSPKVPTSPHPSRAAGKPRPAQNAQRLKEWIEKIASCQGDDWVELSEAAQQAGLCGRALNTARKRLEYEGQLMKQERRGQIYVRLLRYPGTGSL